MQRYSQAALVLQQISDKRKEKRQLSDQLATFQAKEARSKAIRKANKVALPKSNQMQKEL
jgi:hypothetical protein